MRFLPIGPRTLLVELADLQQTLVLFDALVANPVAGIAEIIPAARTLMVRTVPGIAADTDLAAEIAARQPAPGTQPAARSTEIIEIPVQYGGEDLDDVARLMGLDVAQVIAAHQDTMWQVAFCGFAPGFAYMTCGDARFDLPRRPSPRTRIPAGSVALAGRFCGIYPQETPGGWQLIGTTSVPMWDLRRDPPALLRPGVRAQFVRDTGRVYASVTPEQVEPASAPASAPGLRVLATAFPIVFQDEGRHGQGGQGVSVSGALDLGALRRANRAVGNPADVAALELTLGPVRMRADVALTLALAGAGVAVVNGVAVVPGAAFAMDAGDELVVEPPQAGMRSYLALRGGFAVAPVLGSAATDTLAHIGPAAITAGTVLRPAHSAAGAVTDVGAGPDLPQSGDLVALPVTLGPRTDWFPADVVARFLAQEWLVTAQSSRVGIRLQGAALTRPDATELPSEGTETGAIQIPHSGQPVLFLADHPLTGGYPVIATLDPAALDLAAQVPPGARLRFVARHPFLEIHPEVSR